MREFADKDERKTFPANKFAILILLGKLFEVIGNPAPIILGLNIFYLCLAAGLAGKSWHYIYLSLSILSEFGFY